tara:strand:- start:2424 stop:2768 length:345 start_codon:yes stop_codon:yes gene_type:complete
MDINGKVVKVFDIETGTSSKGKDWQKQSILIEQDKEYNKELVITYFGEKIRSLESLKIGDLIKAGINLSSREYNSKWYHNIDGWTCYLNNGEKYDKITALEEGLDHKGEDDLPF